MSNWLDSGNELSETRQKIRSILVIGALVFNLVVFSVLIGKTSCGYTDNHAPEKNIVSMN